MTAPVPLPDFALEVASPFVAASGLRVDEYDGAHVRGHVDLGPTQHTPWGVVHGGAHCSIVESAASIGGSAAVSGRGQVAVGVHNATDLIRSTTGGRAEVEALPVHQGRTQQLWQVEVRQEGKLLARGNVRLQNVDASHLS
ncbi:PaaI family thioesterase [Barrientosiimonas endolithica]|uniref:Esterase n=1 Tax=Barrientosiimonas endolithica TaxID=1535208 RepID=A0ABM8H911_9MICO|nr:PaaI family thioesterase [Barrientosiimonas endolithica]BDZ57374.1 putative esterase [Barrientosiimonas endolithica]